MHAAEGVLVSSSPVHGPGFSAGIKRLGTAANGTPRNLFTVVDEDGKDVVVPTTRPVSIVAVGRSETVAATPPPKRDRVPTENIVNGTRILRVILNFEMNLVILLINLLRLLARDSCKQGWGCIHHVLASALLSACILQSDRGVSESVLGGVWIVSMHLATAEEGYGVGVY